MSCAYHEDVSVRPSDLSAQCSASYLSSQCKEWVYKCTKLVHVIVSVLCNLNRSEFTTETHQI